MKAYRWLGHDEYQYIIFCEKADAMEIIARFGPSAKGPTMSFDGMKYSFYFLNTRDKIITPVRFLSGIFGGMVDEDYIGEQCSLAIFLDQYRLEEYPFRR